MLKLNTPDILALQEIQDGNGTLNDGLTDASVTYQALADAIVSAGGPRYAFADIPPADDTSGGEPGEYPHWLPLRPHARHAAAGQPAAGAGQRPLGRRCLRRQPHPLVGDFQFGREVVTIINIHSSSKGGGTSLFGAVQPAVNGSEEQRIAQAEEINAFVDGLLAEDNRANILVVGDANEFAWNPSQHVMTGEAEGRRGQVLFDLAAEQEPPEERYTYNFDGNAQALDHSLVSRALLNRAEYDTVHLNSEYPDAERVSDHDPSVIQLFLPPGTDWHGMGG
ncbi:endonuclease/exonuclease/phosphatase family protein [Siccirubricoccus deserti]